MDKNLINTLINAAIGLFKSKGLPAIQKAVEKEVAKPVQAVEIHVEAPEQEAPAPETIRPGAITKADLLMGRDKEFPGEYTQEVSDNLDKLLIQINKIQDLYGKKFKVNSGWRPQSINSATPGAAPKSKHMLGLAVDVSDANGDVMNWTIANLDKMKEMGIYMEHWDWTPTWTHYQIVPPKSGNRVFVPSTAPAPTPNRWKGSYSAKFN